MADNLTEQCLTELRKMFPNQECHIQTEDWFWPAAGEKPEQAGHAVAIRIGSWRNAQRFSGATLDEAMVQLYAWYSENSLCAQCCYAVDSSGLCV
jgi:hypothetical protein